MQPTDQQRAQRVIPLPAPVLTVAPLTAADTTLHTVTPQFLQTLSDTLGDHLTDTDGFDALLNDPLTTIDPESATVDSLATVAADAAFTPGDFAGGNLDPIAGDIATFNAGGDAIISGLGVAVTPVAPVTVNPPIVPDVGDDGGGFVGDGLLLPLDPVGGDTFGDPLDNIGFG